MAPKVPPPKTPAEELEFFRTLLRFRTVSAEGPHNGEYAACAAWLRDECASLGLSCTLLEPVAGKPVLVATLRGTEPSLPSVLLNSHYDVVPAMQEQWERDPWAAEEVVVDGEARIYGRGTQDMKCVCAQYLLALRRLLVSRGGVPFRRTLHLTYVPDEEIGGKDGMAAFLDTEEYAAMQPIGCAIDEGLATPAPTGEAGEAGAAGLPKCTVFYGERVPLWVLVTARGPTGHGSRFIADTAVSKLIGLANKALAFRDEEEARLGYGGGGGGGGGGAGCKHCEALKLGDVTTLNLTMLHTGVSLDGGKTYSLNVIPTCARAGFDIRVPPTHPIRDLNAMLDRWCEAEGLSWEYAPWTSPLQKHHVTSRGADNPWWARFESACAAAGMQLVPEVFPAATDSRFLRALGVPAFGFSPMPDTPILLHEHNEYIPTRTFADGVRAFEEVIAGLADAPRWEGEPLREDGGAARGANGKRPRPCEPCAPA